MPRAIWGTRNSLRGSSPVPVLHMGSAQATVRLKTTAPNRLCLSEILEGERVGELLQDLLQEGGFLQHPQLAI